MMAKHVKKHTRPPQARHMKRSRLRLSSGILAATMLFAVFFGNVVLPSGVSADAIAYNKERWQECENKFRWEEKQTAGLTPWTGGKTQPAAGAGTEASPYEASTPEELRWCLENPAGWTHLKITADMDLGGRGETPKNWNNIRITQAVQIDGGGHTLYNLYSAGSTQGVYGLIGEATNVGFSLKNLCLSNVKIQVQAARNDTGKYNQGAATLIGKFNGGTVDNCTVSHALVNGDGYYNGCSGLFAPDGTGCNGITITNTKAIDVNVYGDGCISGFIEGPWTASETTAAAGGMRIENCAAMDGVVISNGGHSGGFTSCVRLGNNSGHEAVYKNCYINDDVYGNNETGVFVGVTHGGVHKFENCFAAGKIEGTTKIGGFFGCPSSSQSETFTNCYSTSMVGMSNGGTYMGGFAGIADAGKSQFINCFAAGEVGTLRSNEKGEPLDENGHVMANQFVTGFIGNNTGACQNCYYDKQTTGMCDLGAMAGVTGLLTDELIGKADTLNTDKDNPVWIASAGGYPELIPLAQSDDAMTRAYSMASVSTVHLYANPKDPGDYDTVRHIRYVFPLTNNENSGKHEAFHISWANYEGEDPEHPLFPNKSPLVDGDVPIIVLANVGSKDSVTSVAPGIGWLQVNAQDKTSGIVGMRRLRLIPTTAIATLTFNDASLGTTDIVTVPGAPGGAPDGLDPLDPSEEPKLTYDHRKTITFVTANSTKLNSFLLDQDGGTLEDKLHKYDISTKPFPEDIVAEIQDDGTLKYPLGVDLSDDSLMVVLEKENEDGTFEKIPWTDERIELFEGKRTADPGDGGSYRLSYSWEDKEGTTIKAQGTKSVDIVEQAYVVFHKNYPVAEGEDETYCSKGYYRAGTPANELPQGLDLTREGYTYRGWSTNKNSVVLQDSARSAAVSDPFDETTRLHGGRNDVYAVWQVNDHMLAVKDYEGNDIVPPCEVSFGTGLAERIAQRLEEESAEPPASETKFLGWTTDPSKGVDIDAASTMPDHGVTVYPVYASKPSITTTVENVTAKADNDRKENHVGDTLHYTVTVKNDGPHSVWQDVAIRNQLPPGLSFVPGSVTLKAKGDADGTAIPDADIYKDEEHRIQYTIGDMPAGSEYVLEFDVLINGKAADVSDTPEGEENRDISSVVEATGTDSDGQPVTDPDNPDNPGNPDNPTDPDDPDKPGGGLVSKPEIPNTAAPDPANPDKPVKPMVTPFDPDGYVKMELTNHTTTTGPARVDDVLEYTITVGNRRENSKWEDVAIRNELPKGLLFVPDSIYLVYPDGTKEHLKDEDVYNPDTHSLSYTISAVGGNQHYFLSFEAMISRESINLPDTDIENTVEVKGKDPHGNPVEETPDAPAVPAQDPENPGILWAKPDGKLTKTARNLTRQDKTQAGDRIAYTLTAQNHGKNSVWRDVVLFDKLPEGLRIDTASLELTKPDGSKVTVAAAAYNEQTRLLSVYAGDLYENESAILDFVAVVEEAAVGQDIGNTGYVYGEEDHKGEPWVGTERPKVGDPYVPEDIETLEQEWIGSEPVYPDSGKNPEAVPAAPPVTETPAPTEAIDAVQTGDAGQTGLGILLLALSAAVLSGCLFWRRKKTR